MNALGTWKSASKYVEKASFVNFVNSLVMSLANFFRVGFVFVFLTNQEKQYLIALKIVNFENKKWDKVIYN